MNSLDVFPEAAITGTGRIGRSFLGLGIHTLHAACRWVRDLPYGYNALPDDAASLFADGAGTCSSKHGVIAELAEELKLPIHKYIAMRLNLRNIRCINKSWAKLIFSLIYR